MLAINDVETRYDKLKVHDKINLQVDEGEFFCLVGVNGAGKSSLIKAILDFIDIDAGSIMINGLSHRTTESRGQLAYLPERFVPPYYLKGKEFIDYMLSLHNTVCDQTTIERIGQQLDLRDNALNENVGNYSKGMAQKLGLMGCLLSGKKLLILDEPMSGLDPKARVLVKRQLYDLKEKGITLFYSSHILADVEEMADKMAILHHGKIHFNGTPKACKTQYCTDTLEKAFIHCINEAE